MSDWQDRAECAGKPSDWFFPDANPGHTVYAQARKVCARCEVTAECLDFALSFEQMGHRLGMFGGMSPKERDNYSRQVRRCLICGARFTPAHRLQRYCPSEECQKLRGRIRTEKWRSAA